ncbi:MAG: ATP-binding cassette domain-containing protein [Chloroflexota bacterium]|nr:ATP-binding cassette domain-containing protein [Chloroflexota bacterium]
MVEPVLVMEYVRVWTPGGIDLLRDVSWTVRPGEHWALLGPNGAAKSTLLFLAGAVRHPSAGAVTLLGGRFGRASLPALRRRVGVVDPSLHLLEWLTVEDVVLTGATGTIRPLWDRYGPFERTRARELLALLGCADLAERQVATCSQGERQRVRIARALMPAPPLLLLDEPATGLDLPAREALLAALAALTAAQPSLATVLVSHHLEELPPSTTHALLLRGGEVVAQGPALATLTDAMLSACFGLDVTVGREQGRWTARAAPGWGTWSRPHAVGSDADGQPDRSHQPELASYTGGAP